MQELPDRWQGWWLQALKPHGRVAVVSSCAVAGVLLISGGLLLANQGTGSPDAKVSNIAAPKTTSPTDATTVPSVTLPNGVTVPVSIPTGSTAPTASQSGAPGNATPTTTAPFGAAPSAPTPSSPVQSTTPVTDPPPATPQTVSTPKPPPANAVPGVSVDTTQAPDDPVLGLKINATDADSYVSSVVVSWGDGSSPTLIANPLACSEPITNSALSTPTSHTYDVGGPYTVSVIVTSSSCDGSNQQQFTTFTQVSVGGASTPTSTIPPATPLP